MRKYIPCLSILILIASLGLISGCQPPASGESAGFRYPFLYSQLMNKKLSGQLPVPVEGVTRKQLQDTWGAARSEGRKHEGIDIFAKRGTPVLSTTEGIVRQVGTNNLGGQVVWVTGPDLTHHYYAHLENYAENITAGDWIEAGEVIGYVGNTGNARGTPPHLHYGIYINRQGAINPYPYLEPN
ncbi:M23 family metallopeptidase [Acinetobacter radioresistens]|uniref:M23 family metallopeptidase n=1 Tax=Acinetobacter radioresistens TaxID=40216 RepID=UPI0020059B1C|nr:M23 family metallopeptidase [Acinetobacter radioresistens]MCK4080450.1 M23 family metallopeptidase [Acinetobacter radioresistens]